MHVSSSPIAQKKFDRGMVFAVESTCHWMLRHIDSKMLYWSTISYLIFIHFPFWGTDRSSPPLKATTALHQLMIKGVQRPANCLTWVYHAFSLIDISLRFGHGHLCLELLGSVDVRFRIEGMKANVSHGFRRRTQLPCTCRNSAGIYYYTNKTMTFESSVVELSCWHKKLSAKTPENLSLLWNSNSVISSSAPSSTHNPANVIEDWLAFPDLWISHALEYCLSRFYTVLNG